MLRKPIFFISLFLISINIIGQIKSNLDSYKLYFGSISKPIELKVSEINKKFQLAAVNSTLYPYLVSVKLDLAGMTCDKPEVFDEYVYSGTSYIANFQPKDINRYWSYYYKFTSTLGNPKLTHNDSITYLIPFKQGKFIKTSRTLGLDSLPVFLCREGDTIYSARKGVVVAIPSDSYSDPSRTALKNNFEVYQNDGTLAIYSPMGKVFKQDGDKIIPGEPIGIALKNYFFIEVIQLLPSPKIHTVSIKYYTEIGKFSGFKDDSEIQIIHPEKIVTKELTKRERKKMKKHN